MVIITFLAATVVGGAAAVHKYRKHRKSKRRSQSAGTAYSSAGYGYAQTTGGRREEPNRDNRSDSEDSEDDEETHYQAPRRGQASTPERQTGYGAPSRAKAQSTQPSHQASNATPSRARTQQASSHQTNYRSQPAPAPRHYSPPPAARHYSPPPPRYRAADEGNGVLVNHVGGRTFEYTIPDITSNQATFDTWVAATGGRV